jgi:hypothetical protein
MVWDVSLFNSMDDLIPMRADDGKVVFFTVPAITYIGKFTDEITRRRGIPRNARGSDQLPSHSLRWVNAAMKISNMQDASDILMVRRLPLKGWNHCSFPPPGVLRISPAGMIDEEQAGALSREHRRP